MRFMLKLRTITKSAALLLVLALLIPALGAAACPLYTISGRMAAQDLDLLEVEPDSPMDAVALSLDDFVPVDESLYVPHVWPVRFSENGLITSYFGVREDPFLSEEAAAENEAAPAEGEEDAPEGEAAPAESVPVEFHAGLDLADKPNSKIYAAASGVVIEADCSGGYGMYLLIDHGNGYTTRYSHCSSLLVEVGDEVAQGQIIATMGATGRATGVHLDFRIYVDGEAIDPLTVLDARSN